MLCSEITEVMKLILSEFLLTSKGERLGGGGGGERINFTVFETLYFFTPASSFLMLVVVVFCFCFLFFSFLGILFFFLFDSSSPPSPFPPLPLKNRIMAFFIFEFRTFMENNGSSFLFENLPIFIICGFMGFLVNILSFFVVQITSSVTLKMLALARNAGLCCCCYCYCCFGFGVVLVFCFVLFGFFFFFFSFLVFFSLFFPLFFFLSFSSSFSSSQ